MRDHHRPGIGIGIGTKEAVAVLPAAVRIVSSLERAGVGRSKPAAAHSPALGNKGVQGEARVGADPAVRSAQTCIHRQRVHAAELMHRVGYVGAGFVADACRRFAPRRLVALLRKLSGRG